MKEKAEAVAVLEAELQAVKSVLVAATANMSTAQDWKEGKKRWEEEKERVDAEMLALQETWAKREIEWKGTEEHYVKTVDDMTVELHVARKTSREVSSFSPFSSFLAITLSCNRFPHHPPTHSHLTPLTAANRAEGRLSRGERGECAGAQPSQNTARQASRAAQRTGAPAGRAGRRRD